MIFIISQKTGIEVIAYTCNVPLLLGGCLDCGHNLIIPLAITIATSLVCYIICSMRDVR